MAEQSEPKESQEIKDEKIAEPEFEIPNNSVNAVEEGEDIQEESEEIEEELDEEDKEQDDSQEDISPVNEEDLIPNKDNFYFELNNSLLTPLNNDAYTTEDLIQKIMKK